MPFLFRLRFALQWFARSRKQLVFVLAGLLLGISVSANSAGLGSLTLHSSLGQHLDAEIEVITDSDTELESIRASMASYEIFAQMGIAPVSVLKHIRFDIDKTASSGAVLKLTSLEPVREPFLDLVVELSWNGGTYLREYTFLLDPVMVQHSSRTSAEFETAYVEAATLEPGDGVIDGEQALMPDSDSVTVVPEHIIVVQRGDNLLDIARSLPLVDLTAEQMAIAIYDANPDAFFGSVHKLKRGAQLIIPDSGTASIVSASNARKRLRVGVSQSVANKPAKRLPDQERQQNLPQHKIADAATPDVAPSFAENSTADINKQTTNQAVAEVTKHMAAVESNEGASSVKALQVVIMELRTAMVGLGRELDVKTSQLDEIGKRVDHLQHQQAISGSNADNATLVVPVPAVKQASVEEPNKRQVGQQVELQADINDDASGKPVATLADTKPAFIGLDAGSDVDSDAVVEEQVDAGQANALTDVEQPQAKAIPAVKTTSTDSTEKTGLFTWFFDTKQNKRVADSLRNAGLVLLATLLTYVLFRKHLGHDESLVELEVSPTPVNGDSIGIELEVDRPPPGEVSDVVNPLSAIEYFREQLTSEQRREQALKDTLAERPEQQDARLELLRVYRDRGSLEMFAQTARDMYAMTGGKNKEWHEVIEMGLSLDPNMSFYDQTGDHGFVFKEEFDIGDSAVTSVPGGKSVASTPAAKQDKNNQVSASSDRARVGLDELVNKHDSTAQPDLDIDLDELPDQAQPVLDEAELDNVVWNSETEDGLTNDELETLKPVEPTTPTMLDSDFELKSESDFDLGESTPELPDTAEAHDDSEAVSYFKPELSWKDCEVRLDLAVVYIDLGNTEGAEGLLAEVLAHGDASQQKVAQGLMSKLK